MNPTPEQTAELREWMESNGFTWDEAEQLWLDELYCEYTNHAAAIFYKICQQAAERAREENDRLWNNHVAAEVIKRGHHGDCMACGTQRAERAELVGRIDELQKLPRDTHARHGSHVNVCIPLQYVNSRRKELEALQASNTKEGE
jgi:hypothetical protein